MWKILKLLEEYWFMLIIFSVLYCPVFYLNITHLSYSETMTRQKNQDIGKNTRHSRAETTVNTISTASTLSSFITSNSIKKLT